MAFKDGGETLINLPSNETDLLSEEKNAKRLAEILRLPFVDLKELSIQTELLSTIPSELLSRYSFIPVSDDGERITIVTADPQMLKCLTTSKRMSKSRLMFWSD